MRSCSTGATRRPVLTEQRRACSRPLPLLAAASLRNRLCRLSVSPPPPCRLLPPAAVHTLAAPAPARRRVFSAALASGASETASGEPAPPSSPSSPLSGAVRRNLFLVAVVAFLDLFSYSLVFPLLPFYAAQFSATSTQTGLLIGSFALAQMLSAPLLGRVSDAAGRKPILLLTTAGTIVGFLIFATSTSLLGLFVARLVDGATGGNTAAAQAYISDSVADKAARAQGFAWLAVAGSLGFVCGPVLGGALAGGAYGMIGPPLLAAGIATVNLCILAFGLPESTTAAERSANRAAARAEAASREAAAPPAAAWSPARLLPAVVLRSPRVQLLLLVRLAWSLAFNSMFTVFSLFLSLRFGLSPAETGKTLAFAGVLQIAAQAGVVAPLTRRFSEDVLLIASLATGGASLALLSLAPSLPWLLAALLPTALASAVFGTVASAALSAAAGPGQTGELLGLSFSTEAATRVVAPVIAGALMGALGASATGVAGAALVACALPVAIASMRRQAALQA